MGEIAWTERGSEGVEAREGERGKERDTRERDRKFGNIQFKNYHKHCYIYVYK